MKVSEQQRIPKVSRTLSITTLGEGAILFTHFVLAQLATAASIVGLWLVDGLSDGTSLLIGFGVGLRLIDGLSDGVELGAEVVVVGEELGCVLGKSSPYTAQTKLLFKLHLAGREQSLKFSCAVQTLAPKLSQIDSASCHVAPRTQRPSSFLEEVNIIPHFPGDGRECGNSTSEQQRIPWISSTGLISTVGLGG